MDILSGYIDHIIYHNEENGYTVFELHPDGESEIAQEEMGEEGMTCVGNFFGIAQGEHLRLTGEYKEHKSYGLQFSTRSYEVIMPQDAEAVQKYLASGAIKGIGPTLAKRIIEAFGDETFSIMENEPERLTEVKGISQRMAMEFSDRLLERRDLRSSMMLLSSFGIGSTLSMRIIKKYGRRLADVLKNNPYQLADEVEGVGFETADRIAKKNGMSLDNDFRIICGVQYVLSQMAGRGNTYVPKNLLGGYASNLLGVDVSEIERLYQEMTIDQRIVIKGENVFLPEFYRAEGGVAKLLLSLDEEYEIDDEEIESALIKMEEEQGMHFDQMQRKAIHEAAGRGVFIMTGGPGTGKTTTIRAMLSYFLDQGMNFSLCAPTGRAAKRMSEATGYQAKTIHRLLGLGVKDDGEEEDLFDRGKRSGFTRDAANPLESDVVVVDEVSMVDVLLMYSLLKAVPVGTRLILVGDANQLPSVGPGNVLKDIIHSGAFSVVELGRIFRQGEGSAIVENAHSINRGEKVSLDNKSDDFFFVNSQNADRIIALILSNLEPNRLPTYVGADVYEVQVLTPTRRGSLGVERLNAILQGRLNPPSDRKVQYEFGKRIFREGDKIMQIKNDYELEWEVRGTHGIILEAGEGVFNGDVGRIESIDLYNKTLDVIFDDDRQATYPFNILDELELAYAMTIHKSQGGEYPAVILPLLPGPRLLYNRNLLYTAITRAKKCVMVIGDENTFNNMIDNVTEARRYSYLKERIEEAHRFAIDEGMR